MKITIEADSINELMSVIKRIANTPPQDVRDEWKIADCGLTDRTVSILRDAGILARVEPGIDTPKREFAFPFEINAPQTTKPPPAGGPGAGLRMV